MAIIMHTDLRNLRLSAIIQYCPGGIFLDLWTFGFGLLLVRLSSADPIALAPENGVLTFYPITDGIAVGSGSAAVGRVILADGVTVAMDGLTVVDNAGTGDIQLSQVGTTITVGQVVSVLALTITEGNGG